MVACKFQLFNLHFICSPVTSDIANQPPKVRYTQRHNMLYKLRQTRRITDNKTPAIHVYTQQRTASTEHLSADRTGSWMIRTICFYTRLKLHLCRHWIPARPCSISSRHRPTPLTVAWLLHDVYLRLGLPTVRDKPAAASAAVCRPGTRHRR